MNKTTNATQARIITPEEMQTFRHALPKSWTRAAGILRYKRKALDRHMRQARREWDRGISTT